MSRSASEFINGSPWDAARNLGWAQGYDAGHADGYTHGLDDQVAPRATSSALTKALHQGLIELPDCKHAGTNEATCIKCAAAFLAEELRAQFLILAPHRDQVTTDTKGA